MERTNIPRVKDRGTKPAHSDRRTNNQGQPVENLVLRAIPDREFELLRPHLESLNLPHHWVLQEPADKIKYAYFLNEGLASLVVLTKNGKSVEVAIVGKEGMVGTPLVVGLTRGACRAVMQIEGRGWRISAPALQTILDDAPELRQILNRCILIQGLEVAQIAACNRLHEIEPRLARWLLMCQDRVGSSLLPITHEFLAQMLGAGRPSVSVAAGILQRERVIENLRGKVKITDRRGLEGFACECYRAIRHFDYEGRLG